MGDFNITPWQYNKNVDSTSFLFGMYINFLLRYILASSIVSQSKTLIDNVLTNSIADGALSWNIITTISDYCAQFLLTKNIKNQKVSSSKYMRGFRRLNKENLPKI